MCWTLYKAAEMAYRELIARDIIGCGIDFGDSHCLVVSKGFTNLQQVYSLGDYMVTTASANTDVAEIFQQASC